MSFRSHGLRIGLRADSPELLEEAREYFPPGWKPSRAAVVDRLYSLRGARSPRPGVRTYNLLYSGAARIVRSMEREALFDGLERDLQLYVAERARDRIFLHAGVVGWNGRAILVPGRSYTGKTTLVRELLAAGAEYYSDEYAVLDAEGRVYPYARPLSLRGGSGGRPARVPAESLGGRVGAAPLPVGLVVVCSYRAGARWRPRQLSPGQAALALLENTVPARRCPEKALSLLAAIAREAPVLKGTRGEAAETARSLLARAVPRAG
jgi:hypothetical protein